MATQSGLRHSVSSGNRHRSRAIRGQGRALYIHQGDAISFPRRVAHVHGPNRNFPGLELTFSSPIRQANGNIVAAGANLAPLFNIAGSEIDANGRVRVTADWVVGTALLLPANENTVTITAKVTDTFGRTGVTRNIVTVIRSRSGQDLTPNPQ